MRCKQGAEGDDAQVRRDERSGRVWHERRKVKEYSNGQMRNNTPGKGLGEAEMRLNEKVCWQLRY